MRIGDKIDTGSGLYVITNINDERIRFTRFDDGDDVFIDTASEVEDALEIGGSWQLDGFDYSHCEITDLWEELENISNELEEAAFEFCEESQSIQETSNPELFNYTAIDALERLHSPFDRCQRLVNRMEAIIEEIEDRAF